MIEERKIYDKLAEILKTIQVSGEFEQKEITRETCPIEQMPEFDSQLWITSISLLEEELEILIPENVNIFLSEDGNRALSMIEIAALVSALGKKGAK